MRSQFIYLYTDSYSSSILSPDVGFQQQLPANSGALSIPSV